MTGSPAAAPAPQEPEEEEEIEDAPEAEAEWLTNLKATQREVLDEVRGLTAALKAANLPGLAEKFEKFLTEPLTQPKAESPAAPAAPASPAAPAQPKAPARRPWLTKS